MWYSGMENASLMSSDAGYSVGQYGLEDVEGPGPKAAEVLRKAGRPVP